MKSKKIIVTGGRAFDFFRPLRTFVSWYSHSRAKRNLDRYPQLAIFAFDHIGLSINLDGRYEDQSLCLIKRFLESEIPDSRQRVMLDIGANIGNHSVYFSEFFGHVYAFEPNPHTFALLRINSELACRNKNVQCRNFGLSDRDGVLPFKENRLNVGGSSIVEGADSSAFRIDVRRADSIVELAQEEISLIKIDVEGHELRALRGAEELIRKNRSIILFEQLRGEICDGSSPVIDYLRGLNYRFATIERNLYFGESPLLRMASLALRIVFGTQLKLVERSVFQKRSYEMIVAVPV